MTRLAVREWHNQYEVPAGSRVPPGLQRDLDDLAPRLAGTLAESAGVLLGTAGSVVLVPELRADLVLDPRCPTDQLIRHWSAHLALALARALEDPASGVMRFPSRADYLARFIADLVRGRAWGQWWYSGLQGLAALPAGAAIRTLVTEDPTTGRATLARLGPEVWPLLAGALPAREAIRILCDWQGQGLGAALDTWDLPGLMDRPLPALPAPLLALYLVASWPPGVAPGADATAVRPSIPISLACWLALLLGAAAGTQAALRPLAEAGDPGPLGRGPWSRDPDWLDLLAQAPPAQRLAAARLATTRPGPEPATLGPDAAPGAAPDWLAAPRGGLVWLLPALADLLDPGLVAALPVPPAEAGWGPRDAAALLTLAIAAGEAGPAVLRDPFWCGFLGLPLGWGAEAAAWLGDRDPAPAGAALTRSLVRCALGEPVLLRLPAGTRLVVERGCGSRLHPGLPPPDLPAMDLPFRERLPLTRLLVRDQRALALGAVVAALPGPWRDPFLTLAQGALRRTANRIPGVARSSIPYLFANVLGVAGRGHLEGGTWVLELARPPLHLLLGLSGWARLRLQWSGDRRIAVECGDPG